MSHLQLLTWLITNLYPQSDELNPIFTETSTFPVLFSKDLVFYLHVLETYLSEQCSASKDV